MPAPSVCDLTFPTDGWVTGAAPDGTATINCDVTTDPSVPVQFVLNDVDYGDPVTSNGSGLASLDVEFPLGPNTLKAIAGTDPETTESDTHDVTVVSVIDSITDPSSKSPAFYFNFLAGETVYNVAEGAMLSSTDAVCAWAGVSPLTYTSWTGPLNIKAGITDRAYWVDDETALNFLAYSTTDVHECVPWLGVSQALLKICQDEEA